MPRTPLDIRRLTPLQMALAAASVVLIIAVAALLVMGFGASSSTRSALRAGELFTDLGSIQRNAYRLHLATVSLLDEDPTQWDDLELEHRLLVDLLDVSRQHPDLTSTMSLGLDRLDADLQSFWALALATRGDAELLADPSHRQAMLDALDDFERSAESLYDREETRFFQRISTGLEDQRTQQVLLVLLSLCAAVFATLLALSLNQSIRFEFDRAYGMLETLFRADEELHRNMSVESVANALAAAASTITGASQAALYVWNDDRTQLHARSTWTQVAGGESALEPAISADRLPEATLAGEIVTLQNIGDGEQSVAIIGAEHGLCTQVLVPLLLAERDYGLLVLCSGRAHMVDSDERRLLAALAHRAASAIQNARLYTQAQEAAAVQERQRLARELHDAVTQSLFAASLIAEVLPRIWERSPEMGRQRLEELRTLTRGALAEMRTLLLELRPQALAQASTVELFRQLTDAISARAQLVIDLDIPTGIELPVEAKAALYRIAQEALNNVSKHAQAEHVRVALRADDGAVVLDIIDDGRGFDPAAVAATHLGLGIMQERAHQIGATLTLDTASGAGTQITVRWPWPQEQTT